MEWVSAIRTEPLTIVMKAFSFLGEEKFFLIFLPLAYWLWRQKAVARLGIVLLATFVLNDFLKSVFQIPRPDPALHLVEVSGWSFPSGHAQSAMVLWGWLAWEIRKTWGFLVAAFLVLAISFSRVYLGVHDILAVSGGIVIGGITLVLYAWLLGHQPDTWRHLGPERQSLVILVILLGSYMLFPDHTDQALKGGAAFIGFLAGVLLEQRYLQSEPLGALLPSLARVILGLVGLLLIYAGLKQVFISIGYQTNMSQFIRYALLGAWISLGVPYLALHLGWSKN